MSIVGLLFAYLHILIFLLQLGVGEILCPQQLSSLLKGKGATNVFEHKIN